MDTRREGNISNGTRTRVDEHFHLQLHTARCAEGEADGNSNTIMIHEYDT